MILGTVRINSTYVIARHRLTGMPDTEETVIHTPVVTNDISAGKVQGSRSGEEEEHVDEERGERIFLTVQFTV